MIDAVTPRKRMRVRKLFLISAAVLFFLVGFLFYQFATAQRAMWSVTVLATEKSNLGFIEADGKISLVNGGGSKTAQPVNWLFSFQTRATQFGEPEIVAVDRFGNVRMRRTVLLAPRQSDSKKE